MINEYQTHSETGPTHEQIATLAYEYWERGGCQPGHENEHWLKAEKALRMSTCLPDSWAALTRRAEMLVWRLNQRRI
jgi:hypothetical protein